MRHSPIYICGSDDEAKWSGERSTGIGASESAAACGMSKYTTQLELYARKRGELPGVEDNYHMLFGRVMEPAIVELLRQSEGLNVIHQPGLYRHPEHSFMLATPDGFLPELGIGLEIKTMEYQVFSKVKEFGLHEEAPDYLFQVHHQMTVLGWDCVRLVALVGKRLMPLGDIEYNEDFSEFIIDGCREMWDRIQNGNPPAIDYNHDSARSLVRRLHPSVTPGVVELGESFQKLQDEYEEISKRMKEDEERQETIRAIQLKAIGDYEGGLLPGRKKMLRRKIGHVEGYTVPPREQLDVRVVNYKNQPVLERIESYE